MVITRATNTVREAIKQDVAAGIRGAMALRGWSRERLMDETGMCSLDVCRLMNSHLERFTLDRLVAVTVRMGLRPQVIF